MRLLADPCVRHPHGHEGKFDPPDGSAATREFWVFVVERRKEGVDFAVIWRLPALKFADLSNSERAEAPAWAALNFDREPVTTKDLRLLAFGGPPKLMAESLKAVMPLDADRGKGIADAAARFGDPEMLRVLLDLGVVSVDTQMDYQRRTIGHFTARVSAEGTRFLLDRGLDWRAVDSSCETVRDYAAGANNPESLRVLLEAGARSMRETFRCSFPVVRAISALYVGVVRDAREDPEGRMVETVRLLLDAGLRAEPQAFETALTGAIVELLLSRGLVPSADSLCTAVREGRVGAVAALIKCGCDVNAGGGYGLRPLHLAMGTISPRGPPVPVEILNLLLGAGADPNALDREGLTPLHHFIDRWADRPLECGRLKALLLAGADPNVRDAAGLLPIDLCSDRYDRERVLYAIEEVRRDP